MAGPRPTDFGVTGTLQDKNKVGTDVVRQITFTTANTDATFNHLLGRKPNGYKVFRTKKGGVVYDGTNNGSDWTSTVIVLRNTVVNDVCWVSFF